MFHNTFYNPYHWFWVTVEKNQIFPLYYYEENNTIQKGMFDEESDQQYIRRDAISDFILDRAKKLYGKNVSKEERYTCIRLQYMYYTKSGCPIDANN